MWTDVFTDTVKSIKTGFQSIANAVQSLYVQELAGFPMVMAVSEQAINAELARAHRNNQGRWNTFPNVPWILKSGPNDTDWSVTVEQFGAPEIDFDTPYKLACRLKMTVYRGTVRMWRTVREGEEHVSKPFDTSLDGLVIYVSTPLKQVQHNYHSQGQLSVQSLFADLSTIHAVELSTSRAVDLEIVRTVTVELQSLILARFKEIGPANPQALMFGLVSIPSTPRTTGKLAPTAMSYSVTKTMSGGYYQTGNLNYLLSTGGRSSPGGETVGVFKTSLLRSGADATLVISERTVLDTVARALIESDFKGIQLGVKKEQNKPLTLAMTQGGYGFGVRLNGRGRSASLRSINSTIENGKIRIQYWVHTSKYGAFKDIDISVEAYRTVELYIEYEQLKVKVSPASILHYDDDWGDVGGDMPGIASFALWKQNEAMFTPILSALNLPGNTIWRFTDLKLDGNLYINARYE